MTSLSPCRRCARRGACDRLADLRQTLRGTGITKANVKCAMPKVDFPIGQPVAVRCFTIEDSDRFNPEAPDEVKVAVSRLGVVMSHATGKFRVLLNVGEEVGPGDRPLAIVGAYHDQLSLVEGREMPVDLCACGLTEDRCRDPKKRPLMKGGDAWSCYRAQEG